MKAGTLLALGLGSLALLTGKALIVSKIALLLAAIIGLKKLTGGGEHTSSYEVVSHGGHGGYGRELSDAQDLAYRGHLDSQ